MNRREGSRLSKDPDPDPDPDDIIDVKEQLIQPKQNIKVIPTPRIKLKHNDISDEEFRLLMEHQRAMKDVNMFIFIIFFFFSLKISLTVICLK